MDHYGFILNGDAEIGQALEATLAGAKTRTFNHLQ